MDGQTLQGVFLRERLLTLTGNHDDLNSFAFFQGKTVEDDDPFWPCLNLNSMNHLCSPDHGDADRPKRS